MSTVSIFMRTLPYVGLRLVAHLVFGLVGLALTAVILDERNSHGN